MGKRRRRTSNHETAEQPRAVDAGNSDAADPPFSVNPLSSKTEGHRRRSRRRRRLVFESLGQRRVLAVITGAVFDDVNGSMRSEPTEIRLAARLAFIDSNNNGQLDASEKFALTDEQGEFEFQDLPTGIHSVRLFDGSSQRQTFPAAPSLSPLPVSFDQGISITGDAGGVQILADQSLFDVDPAGTRATELALPFHPNQLVTAFTSSGRSSALIAGTSLAVGANSDGDQNSGLWIVPAGQETASQVISSSGRLTAAVGTDGMGVLLTSGSSGGQLRALSVTQAAPSETGPWASVAVSDEGVSVPEDAQILASSAQIDLDQLDAGGAPTRTVVAWPVADSVQSSPAATFGDAGTTNLRVSLWNNAAADWVPNSEAILVGATELLSFDDASGLLAVRYAGGDISVLDVEGEFSELLQLGSEPSIMAATLIPGEDAIAVLSLADEGFEFALHDLRSGSELARETFASAGIGVPVSIAAADALKRFYVVGSTGSATVSVERADAHRVEVKSEDETVNVEFGLTVDGENEQPEAVAETKVSADEDGQLILDQSQLSKLVSDSDENTLLPLIIDPPDFGEAIVSENGDVEYRPDADYNGDDSFQVQFHDGRSLSTPVMFSVSVAPQPDIPTGIRLTSNGIPEHVEGRYEVGTLEVEDVDVGDRYELSVHDSRFSIEDGVLVLLNGGMDYEFEPEIQLSIGGYDPDAGEYFSQELTVYIQDENDPVSEVEPKDAKVHENAAGVFIVQLSAYDEDANQTITFSVDDPRFVTVDDELWLKPDQHIDYEREQVLVMTLTASDNAGSTDSTDFTLSIIDEPERINDLTLSNETVLELERGAPVGDVEVNGVSAADSYELAVNDARFEFDGSLLKLRDDVMLQRDAADQIEVTITARDVNGVFDAVSEDFVIEVLENTTPFHNEENPFDVDGNGSISPIDALAIINHLNIFGPGEIGPGNTHYGYDVNGDGFITALDALLVINMLNTLQNSGTVGGEGLTPIPATNQPVPRGETPPASAPIAPASLPRVSEDPQSSESALPDSTPVLPLASSSNGEGESVDIGNSEPPQRGWTLQESDEERETELESAVDALVDVLERDRLF